MCTLAHNSFVWARNARLPNRSGPEFNDVETRRDNLCASFSSGPCAVGTSRAELPAWPNLLRLPTRSHRHCGQLWRHGARVLRPSGRLPVPDQHFSWASTKGFPESTPGYRTRHFVWGWEGCASTERIHTAAVVEAPFRCICHAPLPPDPTVSFQLPPIPPTALTVPVKFTGADPPRRSIGRRA
jgi:hypothetical protein